jgi:hypothetical protein
LVGTENYYLARGRGERFLLALASKERLVSILEKMLDESEFFSEHGIRSYAQFICSESFFTYRSTFVAFRSCTRIIHGGWKSMAKDTKLAIGLASPNPGCLEAILIGAAQSVRDSLDCLGDVTNIFLRASSKLLTY